MAGSSMGVPHAWRQSGPITWQQVASGCELHEASKGGEWLQTPGSLPGRMRQTRQLTPRCAISRITTQLDAFAFHLGRARREATRTSGHGNAGAEPPGVTSTEGHPERSQAGYSKPARLHSAGSFYLTRSRTGIVSRQNSIGGHCLPSERTAGEPGHEVSHRYTSVAQ